jgi:hypothetical protein
MRSYNLKMANAKASRIDKEENTVDKVVADIFPDTSNGHLVEGRLLELDQLSMNGFVPWALFVGCELWFWFLVLDCH